MSLPVAVALFACIFLGEAGLPLFVPAELALVAAGAAVFFGVALPVAVVAIGEAIGDAIGDAIGVAIAAASSSFTFASSAILSDEHASSLPWSSFSFSALPQAAEREPRTTTARTANPNRFISRAS